MSHVTKVARGVAWNIATGVGARLLGLVGTLILTRYISPGEYGAVSTATIAVMTASSLVNLQLGQYIIMRGYREPAVAFHAAFYSVCLGWTAASVVYFARDLLGPWLGAPGMRQFVAGYALASAMEVLAMVPERMLARDLRFPVIAVTRGIGELVYVVLALSSVSFLSGMALVLGAVGRSAFLLAVFLVVADRSWLRPVRLSWTLTRDMVKYSAPLALANMTDFATTRWDNLLIGRFHGTEVMGIYNLSYNLSQTSTLSVADHIADVLFPSFARIDAQRRGQALVRAVSAMVLVVFPLAFGLATIAPTLVAALFPAQWALIAPMLTVLSIHSAANPSSWAFRAFFKADNRTALIMVAGLLRLIVLVGGIVSIGRFGPLWACTAVNFGFVIHLLFMWSELRHNQRSLMRPTARGILQALLACLPMVGSVLLAQFLVRLVCPLAPIWALCIEIPAGVLGFALGAFMFARATSIELLSLLGTLIRARRQSADHTPSGMTGTSSS